MNDRPEIVEKVYKYRIDNDDVRAVVDAVAEPEHHINPAKVIEIEARAGWLTIRVAEKP